MSYNIEPVEMRDGTPDVYTGWIAPGKPPFERDRLAAGLDGFGLVNDYNIDPVPMRDDSLSLTTGWIRNGDAFDDCRFAAGLAGIDGLGAHELARQADILGDQITTAVGANEAAKIVRLAQSRVMRALPNASTHDAKVARGIIRHSKDPHRELREFYVNVAVDAMRSPFDRNPTRFDRYAEKAPLPGRVDASMAAGAATEAITKSAELASEAAEAAKAEVDASYAVPSLDGLGRSFLRRVVKQIKENKTVAVALAPITGGATLMMNKDIKEKIKGAIEKIPEPLRAPIAVLLPGTVQAATYKQTLKSRMLFAAAAGVGAAASGAGLFKALAPAEPLSPGGPMPPMEETQTLNWAGQTGAQPIDIPTSGASSGVISQVAQFGTKIAGAVASGRTGVAGALRGEAVSFLTSVGFTSDQAGAMIDKAEQSAKKEFQSVASGTPGIPGEPGTPGKTAEAGMFGGAGVLLWVVLGLGGLAFALSARRSGGGGGSRRYRRNGCFGPFCMNPRHKHKRRIA